MTTLHEQLIIITYYTLLGMAFAVTFDTLELILKKFPLLVKYLIELVYWFLVIYLTTNFIINNVFGYIRLYTIIFFVFGVSLYYIILSRKYIKRLETIFSYVGKTLKKIFPIVVLVVFPKEVLLFIQTIIKKIFKRRKNRGKKDEENNLDNNNDDSLVHNERVSGTEKC